MGIICSEDFIVRRCEGLHIQYLLLLASSKISIIDYLSFSALSLHMRFLGGPILLYLPQICYLHHLQRVSSSLPLEVHHQTLNYIDYDLESILMLLPHFYGGTPVYWIIGITWHSGLICYHFMCYNGDSRRIKQPFTMG